jgi:hypothetical protein
MCSSGRTRRQSRTDAHMHARVRTPTAERGARRRRPAVLAVRGTPGRCCATRQCVGRLQNNHTSAVAQAPCDRGRGAAPAAARPLREARPVVLVPALHPVLGRYQRHGHDHAAAGVERLVTDGTYRRRGPGAAGPRRRVRLGAHGQARTRARKSREGSGVVIEREWLGSRRAWVHQRYTILVQQLLSS